MLDLPIRIRICLAVAATALCLTAPLAAEQILTGTVLAPDGSGIVGASIEITGHDAIAVATTDGMFSLALPASIGFPLRLVTQARGFEPGFLDLTGIPQSVA